MMEAQGTDESWTGEAKYVAFTGLLRKPDSAKEAVAREAAEEICSIQRSADAHPDDWYCDHEMVDDLLAEALVLADMVLSDED